MLKKFLLRSKADKLAAEAKEVEEKLAQLAEEERALVKDIEQTTEDLSDEDRSAIEEKADDIEEEKKQLEEKKSELEKQIEEIDKKLAELEEDDEEALEEGVEADRSAKTKFEVRGGYSMNLEKRERIRNLLQEERNSNFFENVRSLVTRGMTVTKPENGELLIPEQVFVEILDRARDYGDVIKLVDVISLKGKGRFVYLNGEPKLTWSEMCAPSTETTIGKAEEIVLDGYALQGHVFLCKAFLEDAAIDVADYVADIFAKAIASHVEDAILNGKGQSATQPEGIITARGTSDNTTKVTNILDVLQLVGGLEPGTGDVTLVTNRETYTKYILPETYGKDANGKIVYGLGQTLPDGTKVVLSKFMPKDKILIGYFNEYKLGVRKEMTFDSNDSVKWVEGQIGYKTLMRADGKVTDKQYFKLATFTAPAAGGQ